ETLSFSPFDDDVDDAGAPAGDARTTAAAAEPTGPATEAPPPPVTTFGDLFAGWAFLPLPADVDVSAVWSLILTSDADDVIRWYT
ncbi:hypothetical protein KC220_25635, partial [Mycobacterium tuberculosis]|nr:hypothetical protein [Mycobacterium tuberculosis]